TGATVALPAPAPGGSYAATGTAGGSDATLIAGTPQISGSTLSFNTTSKADGTAATITIPVTGATNHNDYSFIVSVTAQDLEAQSIAFPNANASVNRTYGDVGFAYPVTIQGSGSGAVVYSSDNTAAATVNAATGEIGIVGAGTATISATKAADAVYAEATASYTLTVAPKTLTVNAGNYTITKVYDGAVSAGAASGVLGITGVIGTEDVRAVAGAIPVYPSANAGSYTVSQPVTGLSGLQSGNYSLSASTVTVSVPAAITPKVLAGGPAVTITGAYSYTGSAITPTFTVMDGAAALATAEYTAVLTNNTNAGTATLTVSASTGGNYTWTPAVAETFSIAQIAYAGAKNAETSARYGAGDMLCNLASMLPAGAVLGVPATEGTIFADAPAVSGTSLLYSLVNDAAQAGQSALVTVPVTSTTNYLPFDIQITVTVLDKQSQSGFGFGITDKDLVYGDAAFTETASGQAAGSTVTYESSDAGVAAVDASTGQVTILKAGGPVTITATASATAEYAEGVDAYVITVGKATLTVKPKDVSIYRNIAMPAPAVEYAGLIGTDEGAAVAVLRSGTLAMEIRNADNTDTLADTTVTGKYRIVFSSSPVFESAENYVILTAEGVLTINAPSEPIEEEYPLVNGTTGGGAGGGGMVNIPAANGAVTISAVISGSTATLSLPPAKVTEIISKTADGKVAFDLSGSRNVTEVVVAKEAVAQFAAAGYTVELKLYSGVATLNAAAAASLVRQAVGTSLSISVKLLNVSDIPQAQRQNVRSSDLIYDVRVLSNEQALEDFDGAITVSIPYTGPLPPAVWYLDDDGKLEKQASSYDASTRTVTFMTNHLSLFVVGEEDGVTQIRLVIGELFYSVNGVQKLMDVMPEIISDRTMVPLRFVAEALGAQVGWDAGSRTAAVELNGVNLRIAIGELAPGMDTPAMIVGDRTMIPLRYVSETLGCDVTWRPETRTVAIDK
ncbi:MAG: stalk domain-containing protein, partial [Clostridiales bacterium]|nr:stalk domain-containing protein [Clostridiales bacterium]